MFASDQYQTPYHREDISAYTFLVTGGAGFIGSNLVEYLLTYNAGHVRVLDNLSNGYYAHIKDYLSLPNFEFIEGDIRDMETCRKAVQDIHFVAHHAALGSVPRSIQDPIATNEVNVTGFLNMLVAAKESPILKRFIYAASSSTFGDSSELPKVEGREGRPLSPYAVSKAINEYYAAVFSKVYGFHSIGLRYFNIFGPRQNPDNPYAAVIPLFCKAFLEDRPPTIFGTGDSSRDFTFVENAVQANIRALLHPILERHEVFNVACGEQITLKALLAALTRISGKTVAVQYGPERLGDVPHSMADIQKINRILGYQPTIPFEAGLEKAYAYYLTEMYS